MKISLGMLVLGVALLGAVIGLNVWVSGQMNSVIEANPADYSAPVVAQPKSVEKKQVVMRKDIPENAPEDIKELMRQGIIDPSIQNPETVEYEGKVNQPMLLQ